MVVDESLLDRVKEEVVQTRVDDENNDFRCSIPVLVDFHKANILARVTGRANCDSQRNRWRHKMGWDPDDKDSNIDHRAGSHLAMLGGHSIDTLT